MSKNIELYVYDQTAFQERLSLVIGEESFRSFSQKAGCSDTLLRKYMAGQIPSVEKAAQICSASGIDDDQEFSNYFAWLCLGLGNRPDFIASRHNQIASIDESTSESSPLPLASDNDDVVWIDSLEVFASAGYGFNNDQELGNKLPFSRRWLVENGLRGKRLSLIRVTGDSMNPTLRDKETTLIEILPDDAINRLVDDIYVLRLSGQLLIKRIQSDLTGGILVKSDNPQYESIRLNQSNWPDDFKVIAKWTGKKL